jgi:hypothetical protein
MEDEDEGRRLVTRFGTVKRMGNRWGGCNNDGSSSGKRADRIVHATLLIVLGAYDC